MTCGGGGAGREVGFRCAYKVGLVVQRDQRDHPAPIRKDEVTRHGKIVVVGVIEDIESTAPDRRFVEEDLVVYFCIKIGYV